MREAPGQTWVCRLSWSRSGRWRGMNLVCRPIFAYSPSTDQTTPFQANKHILTGEKHTQNSFNNYALNSSLVSYSIPQCTAHLPWACEFTDSGLCRTAPIISVAGVDGKAVFAVSLESLFTLTLKLPTAKWTLRVSIANSLRTHAWNMIETDDG